MTVELKVYTADFEQKIIEDIIAFWKTHNNEVTKEEAKQDLINWTGRNHELYLILRDNCVVGFVHMGSRGAGIDWLEDLFVEEAFRRQGIATKVIELMWEKLQKSGKETMYLEVVPANKEAMALYHKLGFTNLNTLTLNRSVKKKKPIRQETIQNMIFDVYRPN